MWGFGHVLVQGSCRCSKVVYRAGGWVGEAHIPVGVFSWNVVCDDDLFTL